MDVFNLFMNSFSSFYIPTIRLLDILEIMIIIFLVYKIIKGLKNTRAMILLKGVLILFIGYIIVVLCQFEALLLLFQSLIVFVVFAVIVVFQPELRKFLEQIGTNSLAGKLNLKTLFSKEKNVFKYFTDKGVSELSKACYSMGSVKTGALIVLERDIPLTEYIETGIKINGDLTSQLLINIFEKNTPLHDGAVIINKDKVIAATCYLPLSENSRISKKMGTRHRAAIGLSEVTDCIVLVVSEETGAVSIVVDGEIKHNLSKEDFMRILYKYQVKSEVLQPEKVKNTLSIKNFFKGENASIKLVSIIVGILAWVLLMNLSNPITTRIVTDVPIELVNTSVIESTGKTFDLLSEDTVTVRIRDRRAVVDKISKSDIKVIADFSKLSYVNAVPLTGFIENYPATLVEFPNENSINIELESIISKEVDITVEKVVSENLKNFVPVLEYDKKSIILAGGKSVIDTVDKVVFKYDISNLKETYEGSASPIVYDKNGNVLDNSLFTFSFDVLNVTGKVCNVKEIPLSVEVNSKNLSGYSVSNIDYEPKSIRVSGEDKYLESIENLSIVMDVAFNREDLLNNQLVKILKITESLPEGVYLAGNSEDLVVTLTFEEYETKMLTFNKENVKIVGLDAGKTIDILDEVFNVTIMGEKQFLDSINETNVVPYIDVSQLGQGEYSLILQFEGLDNVILTSNISAKLTVH